MASSLAKQLAQGASLNASLLVDRSRRKPTQSYLFTSREADQHDLDSIYALGVNGFQRLRTIDPSVSGYEDLLFSDAAKATDRTLQNSEANGRLDAALNSFLPLLGPFLLEAPTSNILEWLVRRFRIHEFNVAAVLAVFLPYHGSAHFVKMLSILVITEQSPFSSLLPFKSSSSPITHSALVDIMTNSTNSEFSRFIGSLLTSAIRHEAGGALHRALIAFHTGTILEFLKKSSVKNNRQSLSEGTLAWVLPAAMDPLAACSNVEFKGAKRVLQTEVILSAYLILSALSHASSLSTDAISATLKAVGSCARRVSSTQVLRTMASVCAAQQVVEDKVVSKNLVRTILKLEDVGVEIKGLLKYAGTEKFVAPLVRGLITRITEEHAFTVLTTLVTYSDLPLTILGSIAVQLICLSVQHNVEAPLHARCRSLLIHIQQRQPNTLQKAFKDVMDNAEIDTNSVEQLTLSLSIQLPESANGSDVDISIGEVDLLLATINADNTVRASAVRTIYDKLAKGDLGNLDLASIRSALLARVQDSHATVIETLYSKPTELLSIILGDPSAYISSVEQILHVQSPAPGRALTRAHLSFVTAHLYPALVGAPGNGELRAQIFQKVFFPFLLFSKPRQKTATMVWELIEKSEADSTRENAISHYALLNGTVEAVRWEEGKIPAGSAEGSYEVTEALANVNIALATKLADNIQHSAEFSIHLDFLLSQLRHTNPYPKALAYLVFRALLPRLSGTLQLDVGHKLLKAIDLTSLDGMDEFLRGADNLQVFLHDLSLSTAVVLKPTKPHTLQRLQVAILTALSTLSCPAGMSIDWLGDVSSETSSSGRYMELVRSLYLLANSSASLPHVSAHIIRGILASIGESALNFLTGIGLRSSGGDIPDTAAFASLRHAAAYLEAHYSSQRFIDFQVIVPALLVSLSHKDRRMREAALDCVTVMARLSQAKKPESVYGFDVIYGSSSVHLQYLEWSDFCKYIQVIQQAREHILHDPEYLPVLHQRYFSGTKTDSRKDAAYKERVLCYLLSHVRGCPLETVKIAVLKCLQGISSSAKCQMLLPVLEETTGNMKVSPDVSSMLLASIDKAAANTLNDEKSTSWAIYTKILGHYFRLLPASIHLSVLSQNLQSGLYGKLRTERKVEVCSILLECGRLNSEVTSMCRALLVSLLSETTVILHLLSGLQPSSADAGQRATKRPRIDSGSVQKTYATLIILAEVLGAQSLPGSPDLLSCLLDTLSNVIHDASVDPSDKTYVEQLLLSALENVVNNIPTGLSLPSVRLDILIELIRVSENPQTFHQALLLIAGLAKLMPEAVLQNAMPIFTFMGSNVFHRDDIYSFKVVQKTIESIVPVMITSLKNTHTDKLQLQIASRDFLRIFADAAHHIPRHRRVSFFTHLVDVLGADDFLAPICLLLVDKVSNKVVRQTSEDIVGSLYLPLSMLQRSDPDVQVQTLVETLQECRRLIDVELLNVDGVLTFLEAHSVSDDERSGSATAPKRQAQAILTFASLALQQIPVVPSSSKNSSSELLGVLLDISVTKEAQLTQASLDQVSALARDAIEHTLKKMAAKDFILGVQRVLDTDRSAIQKGALDIFGEQLPNVGDKIRQDMRAAIVNIVEAIKKMIPSSAEALLSSALAALKAIASTMSSGEEYVLTSTVSLVVQAVQKRKATASALGALLTLSQQLGPRMIPYFKDINQACVGVLAGEDSFAQGESIGVLHALLTSIPNFWSSNDFVLIIDLYLKKHSASGQQSQTQLSSFVKTLAKRAPSKILLPALCDMWVRLAADDPETDKVTGYLFVMKRAIQTSEKAVLSDHLRALFKTFLDIFNLCATKLNLQSSVESDAISAFVEMVVKLNEAIFKPLFRKLFDWALTGVGSTDGRKLVFLHLYSALLDYFKSLMTPYMTFLIQPVSELLNVFKEGQGSSELWPAVIETLTKAFIHDEGAFWREDKLRQLVGPLIAQVPVCLQTPTLEHRDLLKESLVALVEVINDPSSLKTVNLELLVHTRSEDSRVRSWALICSEALWKTHGGKLIGFAPETATFIAECAEDEHDGVVREAHRLKNAVESIAGRINV